MFPFQNITLFEFNKDCRYDCNALIEAATVKRHQVINDDAPVDLAMGFSSYDVDSDVFDFARGNPDFIMLRFIVETRDVNAKRVTKLVNKKQAALEADGKILDLDQILQLTTEVRKAELSQTPSTVAVVHILFDLVVGTGMVSSTSKALLGFALQAVNQLNDEIKMTYKIDLAKDIPNQFSDWVRAGNIGNGLVLGGNIKAHYDKCKLTLENADLTTDLLSELLGYFKFSEISFSGNLVTEQGFTHRYLSGRMKDSGQIVGIKWLLDDDTYEQVYERGDYDAASFDAHAELWRLLIGQLTINVYSLGSENRDGYLADVFAKTCSSDSQPISDDIDNLLYQSVVKWVIDNDRCSISSIQRYLKIGYNTAARLVEELERQGVVSNPGHNGTREVLTKRMNKKGDL
jgi:hypothetical protein